MSVGLKSMFMVVWSSGPQYFVFCLSISGCPALSLVGEIILAETVLRADKYCG